MTAPLRQARNSRRHPARSEPAGSQQVGMAPGDLPGAAAQGIPRGREPLTGRPAAALRCARAAAARRGGPARRSCLTPRGSRIGSESENARKSEGFDVFRRSMNRPRGRSAVSEHSSRPGERGQSAELPTLSLGASCAARPGRCVAVRTGSYAGCDGATEQARERAARRSHALLAAHARCVQRRGTGLAVASGRVRFRLGGAPGVEESAG